jgi:hypothetical protein
MGRWLPIETAPVGLTVRVKVGRRSFRAAYMVGASIDEDGNPCDQWQALDNDYPKCWSGGACWESNADGFCSAQPEAWRLP